MQTKMNFTNDKLSYIDCPADDDWAWDLRWEREKKFRRDVLWLSKLLDEYSE